MISGRTNILLFYNVQTGFGTHSYKGLFPWEYGGQGVKLIIHLYTPRLRMGAAVSVHGIVLT